MDIGFDFSQHGQDAAPGRLDWHGLRARLFAVRAARRALEAAASENRAIDGSSFDRGSARLLAGYGHVLAAVNPTALGNGKPSGDMNSSVAGESRTGGRG